MKNHMTENLRILIIMYPSSNEIVHQRYYKVLMQHQVFLIKIILTYQLHQLELYIKRRKAKQLSHKKLKVLKRTSMNTIRRMKILMVHQYIGMSIM